MGHALSTSAWENSPNPAGSAGIAIGDFEPTLTDFRMSLLEQSDGRAKGIRDPQPTFCFITFLLDQRLISISQRLRTARANAQLQGYGSAYSMIVK
jgi:hypothetical protein